MSSDGIGMDGDPTAELVSALIASRGRAHVVALRLKHGKPLH
jgi:hypothetical protein